MGGRRERPGFDVILDSDDLGAAGRVGFLRGHENRSDVPTSFEYDADWLASDRRFLLDPRLELWSGEQYPHRGFAFGIFLDSAPDRWGRVLMERREASTSRREGRPMRTLGELDFLLGVHDQTRSGALRFRASSGGAFLDNSDNAAPPITSLPELADIVRRIEEPGVDAMPEYDRWLAMLVAPGTSLGGARPKASFTDARTLWIAKFPARDDRYDVGAWEYVTHQLATRAGIAVPTARLERISGEFSTYCVERFDRTSAGRRRMFASASTLLEHDTGANASYLDIAQLISDHGVAGKISEDLEQLFRRVLFNVFVGNRDDHVRNHGLIRVEGGWRLAPAYDVNPNPFRTDHVLTFDGRTSSPDLDVVMETSDFYRVNAARSHELFHEVRDVVKDWESEARQSGVSGDEVTRMRSVFLAS